MSENARPYDAPIVVDESIMQNQTLVSLWRYKNQHSVLSRELLDCAKNAGVCIFKAQHGNGLKALQPLKKGFLIPYWGKLSCLQRDGGSYNAQITENILVIADAPEHRGPGSFCNDNTIENDSSGHVQKTIHSVNAKLTWTIPTDNYLDDWVHYKNDGSAFKMFVELTRDVSKDEEISVSYGDDDFWRDGEQGMRMSNPINCV